MVARLVRDQEVVGSNPVTSTTQKAALTVAFLRGRGGDSIPVRFSAKGAQVCALRKPDELNEKQISPLHL